MKYETVSYFSIRLLSGRGVILHTQGIALHDQNDHFLLRAHENLVLAWCFRCHALNHQEQSSHLGELDIASGWFWDQADKLALLHFSLCVPTPRLLLNLNSSGQLAGAFIYTERIGGSSAQIFTCKAL